MKETDSSPMREFLFASRTKRSSGDEMFHFILQLPTYVSDVSKFSQAGVMDFENQRLIMCAFLPNGKYFIYSCEYTNHRTIPWDTINQSLKAAESEIDTKNSSLVDTDEKTHNPSIEITSPSSPGLPFPFKRDDSNLIRLEIVLKDKSWIHFMINGHEIGNNNYLSQYRGAYIFRTK